MLVKLPNTTFKQPQLVTHSKLKIKFNIFCQSLLQYSNISKVQDDLNSDPICQQWSRKCCLGAIKHLKDHTSQLMYKSSGFLFCLSICI